MIPNQEPIIPINNELTYIDLNYFEPEQIALAKQNDKVQEIYSSIKNEVNNGIGCLPNCDCYHCFKAIKATCLRAHGLGENGGISGACIGAVSCFSISLAIPGFCCLGPGIGAWVGGAMYSSPVGVTVGKALVGASLTITSLCTIIGGCAGVQSTTKV